MSIEICLVCDKRFTINDGFNNERSITCVGCLKDHFISTTEIKKMLKKLLKKSKKEAK